MLERPARDKHSYLFGLFINDEEKKFCGIGPSLLLPLPPELEVKHEKALLRLGSDSTKHCCHY
jgi:hypothetical protein